MTVYENNNTYSTAIDIKNLKFHGIDSWNRAVFIDTETNTFYCFTDVLYSQHEKDKAMKDLLAKKYDLITKMNNSFDGEPDYPVGYL